MQPWQAERSVSESEAKALISEQFPELAGHPIQLFGEGWDNRAFLVGDKVFRFPRRQIAVPLLERECGVLPQLQHLPLPVPHPRWRGRPTPRFPWPFAGYPRLPGQPAVGVDEAVRARLAAPLGRFLRALHESRVEGLAADELGRMDIPMRTAQAKERAAKLGLAVDDLLEVPPPGPRPTCPVHGDLYALHLLTDGGEASGVIDWGDVHQGEPAGDLMMAFSFFGPAARETFLAAYGPVDEETLRLARFRAVVHSLALLGYARDRGDSALGDEAHRVFSGQ
jgi:aminoglycoside phosphotransferase (APT) family kinase protein